MIGVSVALMLFIAVALALKDVRLSKFWKTAGANAPGSSADASRPRSKHTKETDADLLALPAMVHEIASLLEAGRSSAQIWLDLEQVAARRQAQDVSTPAQLWSHSVPIFSLCARYTNAGLSAAIPLQNTELLATFIARRPAMKRVFRQLGTCIDVSERSGAPLKTVLRRFARQLEEELDAEGARRTALAGPKATVALLRWLPLFGLVLGAVAGADPLAVFFGSAWGLSLLVTGGFLMLAGALWSHRLVKSAEVAVQ